MAKKGSGLARLVKIHVSGKIHASVKDSRLGKDSRSVKIHAMQICCTLLEHVE